MNQQRCFIGSGSLSHLQQLLDDLSAERVLLITGRNSFTLSGAQPVVENALSKRDYYHVQQSPQFVSLETLETILNRVREFQPDSAVAVGGGTVLDAGKLLSLLSQRSDSALDLTKADVTQWASLPLIAIPTTAGTGSESTHFAAAYVAGRKVSIGSPGMLPYGAIIDADLTLTLSPYQTACTGMDALSQARESFLSRSATAISQEYARAAILLAREHLVPAVKNGWQSARIAMAQAAHLSGMAINLTGTTAPHAFSYGFTFDCGIPHGHAVALTLPEFFKYNAAADQAQVDEICRLLDVANAQEAADMLRKLMTTVGLSSDLLELGIGEEKLAIVASKVDPVRLNNNPRPMSQSEFLPFLRSLIRGRSGV